MFPTVMKSYLYNIITEIMRVIQISEVFSFDSQKTSWIYWDIVVETGSFFNFVGTLAKGVFDVMKNDGKNYQARGILKQAITST